MTEPPRQREKHPPDGLPDDLATLARSDPDRLARRMESLSLSAQAEAALRLPAAERLEVLLHAPKPMALVRSLPDAELYLTAREVGPTDALPLLALASAPQIQHLIDLESWRGDRFDPRRSGAWTALLLEAGEPTLRGFLRAADDELLALLLQSWLGVHQLELDDGPGTHGPGQSETGDERGYVTPDGNHRISPLLPEHGPAARRLLQIFFEDQPERYHRILWSALWELPAEIEESALRWRQSRLEEHGFPPWDEAIAVYAPPAGVREHPRPPTPAREGALAAPRLPLRLTGGSGALSSAVEGMSGDERERVLHEVVSLANRLLVADGGDTGNPAVHRAAVAKAAGYLGIALALRQADESQEAASLLRERPVLELFREGYAAVVELRARARRLLREGWGAAHEQATRLLDPPVDARIEALLGERPRYLDAAGGDTEHALRDFRSLAEIEETRVSIELAEVVGGLFVDRVGLDVPRLLEGAEAPRFSTLLLTLLAWHATRGELRCAPLPPDVVATFLRNVASRRTAAPDAPVRAMEALLAALAQETALSAREVALLRGFGRACLERLASECSNLDPGTPLDARYVSCLLLAEAPAD